jgi:hypothetical protein
MVAYKVWRQYNYSLEAILFYNKHSAPIELGFNLAGVHYCVGVACREISRYGRRIVLRALLAVVKLSPT